MAGAIAAADLEVRQRKRFARNRTCATHVKTLVIAGAFARLIAGEDAREVRNETYQPRGPRPARPYAKRGLMPQ